jgi:hypothetical protein
MPRKREKRRRRDESATEKSAKCQITNKKKMPLYIIYINNRDRSKWIETILI